MSSEASIHTNQQPSPFRRGVLLVDSDPDRQFARAAEMRRCGITVDCATATAAFRAWQPDQYALVLVEFRNAGASAREFCEQIARLAPRQRIGLYCGAPKLIVPWTGKGDLPTEMAGVAATA